MHTSNNVKGDEAASIDLCLKQLDTDYVDLLLIHNPTTTVEVMIPSAIRNLTSI